MSFRQEYNGCKSFGCPNCGVPDLSLYSRSNRLGYDAWHCPECGAYPPVLINEPILALAHQLHQQTFELNILPQCHCCTPSWQRYGKTTSGSARVKCRNCQKTATLLNPVKEVLKLQPLMNALFSGVLPQDLQYSLGLSHHRFSHCVERLATVLDTFSRIVERRLDFSSVQTRAFVQKARSGFRHDNLHQSAVHVWTLSSVDAQTGYVILLSDNAWFPQVERSDYTIPEHLLEQSRYRLKQKEAIPNDQDVFIRAQRTYDNILQRSQFDQLAYCDSSHAQSKEVLLTRPVFAAHAHMQNLVRYFEKSPPASFLLQHESFLRGAAITAFTQSIKNGNTQLYYIHVVQCNEFSRVKNAKLNMSWWDETWRQLNIKNQFGNWQVGIGQLTQKGSLTPETIEKLIPANPDWNAEFWNRYTQWLPSDYATHLSLFRIKQWQVIYRFLYNFSQLKQELKTESLPVNVSEIQSIVEYINHSIST